MFTRPLPSQKKKLEQVIGGRTVRKRRKPEIPPKKHWLPKVQSALPEAFGAANFFVREIIVASPHDHVANHCADLQHRATDFIRCRGVCDPGHLLLLQSMAGDSPLPTCPS
jgi:hypothetical protein